MRGALAFPGHIWLHSMPARIETARQARRLTVRRLVDQAASNCVSLIAHTNRGVLVSARAPGTPLQRNLLPHSTAKQPDVNGKIPYSYGLPHLPLQATSRYVTRRVGPYHTIGTSRRWASVDSSSQGSKGYKGCSLSAQVHWREISCLTELLMSGSGPLAQAELCCLAVGTNSRD